MKQDPFPAETVNVRVPPLTVEEKPVQFVCWLVAAETAVISGERIAELLTDGIVFQLEAPAEGRLRALQARPGQRVSPGDVLARIDSEAEQQSRNEFPA